MSWFNRRPKLKEPSKHVPHHTSPMTEKKLEELKQSVKEGKRSPRQNN